MPQPGFHLLRLGRPADRLRLLASLLLQPCKLTGHYPPPAVGAVLRTPRFDAAWGSTIIARQGTSLGAILRTRDAAD
ncbi:hypothetical protein E2562_008634 [Oryza meyeriana var. granulata]|uniref:Uncharacterized protein n=1 Tax=Oryza meyeriana var. granulata TaxID=110450 RepID=A0A6G1F5A7_9ORYZ|nr:hypothetical protein E2562_008634 [Oryza meyeriana var. granulata]